MTSLDPNILAHTVTIAPAPGPPSCTEHTGTMTYNCQLCVRRKVKCDRSIPACSRCIRGKFQCVYQAPPPRRKRKRNDDVRERLTKYERTLQENGLLPTAETGPSPYKESPQSTQEPIPLAVNPPAAPRTKKLRSGDGKSRYIDSNLWIHAEEVNMREISEEDGDDPITPMGVGTVAEDPLSDALLGCSQNLASYHPSHDDAMKLWTEYVQNVDPLCKILHTPTAAHMMEKVTQQPATASKAQQCLLFAVYHFAVFSMTDEDCMREFGCARMTLLSKYRYAIRQALVNASWLKTTEIPVMQAYVLYLMAIRTESNPHTYWILTGVAVRIAQRMGLHRDGESLGLPPFDVELRRRLFWQLVPLDGYASQVSGTGITIAPNSWDTKQPLNLNDDQLYPDMTHRPEEQKGASEMIFCLIKTELSNFYNRVGVMMKETELAVHFGERTEVESLVDEVESVIESRFLRYCEIVNPLHVLTLGTVRSAANMFRLHNRVRPLMNQTIDDRKRRELCGLAQKILDTDNTVYGNPTLKRFRWHVKAFFIWDALICILTSLAKPGFFSRVETDTTWATIAEVYSNHQDIFDARGALHVAVGRVTLEAWTTNPPGALEHELSFITTLRLKSTSHAARRLETAGDSASHGEFADSGASFDELFGGLDGVDLDVDGDFNLSTADWAFWDRLCHGPNHR